MHHSTTTHANAPTKPPAGPLMAVRRGFGRTSVVWSVLGVATLGLTTALWALDGRPLPEPPAPATLHASAGNASTAGAPDLAPTEPLRPWAGVVIHHSGERFDTVETIESRHHASKLASIGYHFVIGNGAGLGDGEVRATERWRLQQPGAHTSGTRSEWHNRNTIGICLVGDGEREAFTPAQIESLMALVRELGVFSGFDAPSVVLHREVARVVSPGRWFPTASFRERLAGEMAR